MDMAQRESSWLVSFIRTTRTKQQALSKTETNQLGGWKQWDVRWCMHDMSNSSREKELEELNDNIFGVHRHKTKCMMCNEMCLNKKDKQKHIDERHRIW